MAALTGTITDWCLSYLTIPLPALALLGLALGLGKCFACITTHPFSFEQNIRNLRKHHWKTTPGFEIESIPSFDFSTNTVSYPVSFVSRPPAPVELEFTRVGGFCKFQGLSGSESLLERGLQCSLYPVINEKKQERRRNCEDREVNKQRLHPISLVNFEIPTTTASNFHLSGCKITFSCHSMSWRQ